VYLLESLTDISSIYEESDAYYNMYRMMMIVLILVMTVVVFAIAGMLTHSVNRLSHTTRRFTNGDLDARAVESGGDEIAELSKDFNRMAVTLSDKMEELTLQAQRQEDFTASFSHELKTPLTSIIGYADMLRTMDCTKEEVVDAAGYIYHQGKRLDNLSRKMLDMIVAVNLELNLYALDVRNLVEEAVQITDESRQKQNVTLTMELQDGSIEGDRTLLISAVTNILENARRAMPSGGKILIQGRNYPKYYLLCVSDNGCGIESKEISRITEAFYMIDKSRARREGGAGLGLARCSRILALHGAHWKIFSRPGMGTDIAIRFRSKEVQDEDL
ncbi:MAG: HAMP domain-containing histidine kinase, partial [Lachnospiraceae bacterium]|nr:HAMP domain-containing histidine kinase [Lachnospiraceae bacterium]